MKRQTDFERKLGILEDMLRPIIDELAERVLHVLEQRGHDLGSKPEQPSGYWLGARGDALSEAHKAASVELTPELIEAGVKILREPNAPVLGRSTAALYFDSALELGFADEIRRTHLEWREKLDAFDVEWRKLAEKNEALRGALSLIDPGLRGAVSFAADTVEGALSVVRSERS